MELQINQDNIDSKLDTLETQQDDLSTKVTSVSSELQQTKICLLSAIQNVCVEPGSGSGLPPLLDDCLSFTCDDCYTCGGTGGWRRVASLPEQTPTPTAPLAGVKLTTPRGRVVEPLMDVISVTPPTSLSLEESTVESVVKLGPISGERPLDFYGNIVGHSSIDESGVAVMHGSPRQHIWTFAAGAAESYGNNNQYVLCPCDTSVNIPIPPFDYFCESGYVWPGHFVCYIMCSTLVILSGMDMVVIPPVPVAHSIILHTSPKPWPLLPLMILNCDCVALILQESRM